MISSVPFIFCPTQPTRTAMQKKDGLGVRVSPGAKVPVATTADEAFAQSKRGQHRLKAFAQLKKGYELSWRNRLISFCASWTRQRFPLRHRLNGLCAREEEQRFQGHRLRAAFAQLKVGNSGSARHYRLRAPCASPFFF